MRKHIETLEGEGELAVSGQSFTVLYRVDVLQEYVPTGPGADSEKIPGLKSLKGLMNLLERGADLFQGGEGILTMSDGRRISINIPPVLDIDRSFSFTLKDAMDLK